MHTEFPRPHSGPLSAPPCPSRGHGPLGILFVPRWVPGLQQATSEAPGCPQFPVTSPPLYTQVTQSLMLWGHPHLSEISINISPTWFLALVIWSFLWNIPDIKFNLSPPITQRNKTKDALQSQEKVCIWQERLFLFNYSFFPVLLFMKSTLCSFRFFDFGNSNNNNGHNNNNNDDNNF